MTKEERIKAEEKLRGEIEKDFEHNYFVKAGAGAGKTALVVNRITEQLRSGKYKAEQIVAITFTNKAAQELCERIGNKLRQAKVEDPANRHIENALQDIGRMQISTIHSFCYRILKENCFAAEIRLDAELLVEEDDRNFKEKFLNKWLKEKTNADEFAKLLSDEILKKAGCGYGDIKQIFLDICDLPVNVNLKYENPGNKIFADYNAELLALAEEKDRIVKAYKDAITTALATVDVGGVKSILAGKPYLDPEVQNSLSKGFRESDGVDEIFNKLNNPGANPLKQSGKGVNATEKSIRKEIASVAYKTVENDLQNVIKTDGKLKSVRQAYINSHLLDFVDKARKEYRGQLFNRQFTNDILLQKTNELLNDGSICEKLRKQFKCIYVDEFQDTDPIQNELILKLCRRKSDDETLLPGLLFLVGDVKQSIYRFRGADYRLFNTTEALFMKDSLNCRVVSLCINNRSNTELVEYFNLKTKALEKGGKKLIPNYEDMIPRHGMRTGENILHGVYKIETQKDFSSTEKPDNLVELIKHIVGRMNLCEYDSKSGAVITRTVEYRDLLILTRDKTRMGDYVEALQNAGIPARISLEYMPSKMIPLKRFALIYRYLAMPFYQRAKEGILEIAQDQVSCSLLENEEKLKQIKAEVRGMNGAELAGYLLEKGEWYLFDRSDIDGCRIKRYQMAIRQMVDNTLATVANNPVAVAEALAEYVAEDNACDRETGFDKDENAVRLMNIHKAKGLEGNIVIIAQRKASKDSDDTYTEGNDRYQAVTVNKKHYATYPLDDIDGIEAKSKAESEMEEARIEYVAVTRAREALIFMEKDEGKNSAAEEYAFDGYAGPDVPEFFEAFPISEENPLSTSETENCGKEDAGPLIHSEKADECTRERRDYRISPSSLEIHGAKAPVEPKCPEDATVEDDYSEPVAPMAEDDDFDQNETEEIISEAAEIMQKRPSGDIFGTVMHRAFELAVKMIRSAKAIASESDMNLCVNRAINESSDDIEVRYKAGAESKKKEFQEYLGTVVPKFAEFISDMIISADEVFTELPFSMTVTGEELEDMKNQITSTRKIKELLPVDGREADSSLWINGKADLVIRKGGLTTIWDYKSDSKKADISDEEFAVAIHDKYDNQMNLYKWVFAKHFEGSIEGKFYSIEIGEV